MIDGWDPEVLCDCGHGWKYHEPVDSAAKRFLEFAPKFATVLKFNCRYTYETKVHVNFRCGCTRFKVDNFKFIEYTREKRNVV